MITRQELIKKWFDFYLSKQHKIIKSASLIPENDPSVLFTTAGMHPLVPYLLGEKHPDGKRLCNVQKCVRTGDIDEVGDIGHLTFFEMLGNWSLGDYFKKEKVAWSYEFLTSPKYLGLKLNQLAVTCFKGNDNVQKDDQTAKYWESQGIPKDKIFFLDDNWWEIYRGPCGPDSEMFLDTGAKKCSENCNPSCNCGKYLELGNDVYMEYNKIDDNKYILAKQKNVDTGFGLERCLLVLNNASSIYVTELFYDAILMIEKLSGKKYNDKGDQYTKSFRIIADHIRTSTAILGDEKGIVPANTDAGYILRRLIRRAIRHCMCLGIEKGNLGKIAEIYIEYFKGDYPEFKTNKEKIISELSKEEDKFYHTVNQGMKEFDKVIEGIERKKQFLKSANSGQVVENIISGKAAFRLFDTFGFPIELTVELAKEKGYTVDIGGFNTESEEHKALARTTSAGKFKGGLADNDTNTVRLHTAAHLMLAGLQKLFDKNITQKGSNINSERLRFDFNFERKLTDEEVAALEAFVNGAIKKSINVQCYELPLEKAKAMGAHGVFDSKYTSLVKVYSVDGYSMEICGGPHVKNTAELGKFKVVKQEPVSSGIRRIKAILE